MIDDGVPSFLISLAAQFFFAFTWDLLTAASQYG